MRIRFFLHFLMCVCVVITMFHSATGAEPTEVSCGMNRYPVYPKTCDTLPDIPSPHALEGAQFVTALQKDGRYVIIPVTVENLVPTASYGARKVGKGDQLSVDEQDFPSLVKTGLHSVQELDRTTAITGKAIRQITKSGRPGVSSDIGFMADDEDILSVLKGDNRLVQRMGLTHPQLARPLFHIWNLILKEYEAGRMGRFWDNIQYVLYKGRKIRFGRVHPTRGFQESIFHDEIMGAFDIQFYRELDENEIAFLKEKYPALTEPQMADLVNILSHIRTGEMEPYYVMRYGFYEGHTAFRVDPIAIAFIFGLRSLEQIEAAFPGRLYEMLTMRFTPHTLPPAFRLTTAEVLQLADAFAAKKRAEYEIFDLKFYPERKAAYDSRMKKWVVHYVRRPNRWPGDHFSVLVDDATGEYKYIGGR